MDTIFDVDRLRISDAPVITTPSPRPKTPRHKPGELFLKGPIPWSWIEKAARLPGSALAVALVAWHLRGLRRSSTFRLEPSKVRTLGLSPRAARRGVKALENAGLIAVDRHRGRSPDVTMLSA